MNIIYYNYYYKEYKELEELYSEINQLYASNISYTPRRHIGSVHCLCYNLARMVKYRYDAANLIMFEKAVIPDQVINGISHEINISQRNTVNIIKTLDSIGLLKIDMGYRVTDPYGAIRSESSSFTLSSDIKTIISNLVDLDSINIKAYDNVLILKDSNKQEIPYNPTNETDTMVEQLERYNALLSSHTFTIATPPSPLAAKYRYQAAFDISKEEKEQYLLLADQIDINETKDEVINLTFRRVFNDSSWESGGRFYTAGGTLQTLSQHKRKRLKIDGIKTVELDFKALHLALLYEKVAFYWYEGFDPYNTSFGRDLGMDLDDLYEFTLKYGIATSYNPVRNLIKLATLVMLNSDSDEIAKKAIRHKVIVDNSNIGKDSQQDMLMYGINIHNIDYDDLMHSIKRHNWAIKAYFNFGYGKSLQNVDSKIMSGVVEDFLDMGKVCISIHDSAVCKQEDQHLLYNSMISNYQKVIGSSYNAIVEVK